MAISLTKGQKIDLTKTNPGLSNVVVGLGWDEVKSKGFFGGLGSANIDCDASVFLLDSADKLKETVYFGNLSSSNNSVRHAGDNLTGAGDGDDEQISVNLESVPSDIHKLVFVVNIYQAKSRNQDFGKIQNAYIRVTNGSSNEELIRFNLSDDYNGLTALVTGELYRHNGEWKFNAIGNGTTDGSLQELQRKYQ